MRPRRVECSRGTARWLGAAALLAFTPKCVLCLLGWAGVGAALGLGGPELCGAPAAAPGPWANGLAWLGAVGGVGAGVVGFVARRRRTHPMRMEACGGPSRGGGCQHAELSAPQ